MSAGGAAHDSPGAEYDARYYGANYERATGHPYRWGEPAWHALFDYVAGRIVDELAPASVLDVGCALGFLVGALRARGVDAKGIDVSRYAISQVPLALRDQCGVGSVTDPIEGRYDLVICIEILEHVPEALAETAIGNLCAAADTVLFSSTPDDFEEETHVNVRPAAYWEELFARVGFRRTAVDPTYVSAQAMLFERGTSIAGPTHAAGSVHSPPRARRSSVETTSTPAVDRSGRPASARLRGTWVGRNALRVGRLVWWSVSLQLRSRLAERRARIARDRERGRSTYGAWIAEFDDLDETDLEGARALGESLSWQPMVSLLMPVFDPEPEALRAAIESVRVQTYTRWQLCIADDCSTDHRVAVLLDEAHQLDPRIEVVRRTANGGISAASNSALELARGELVAFVDHDDVLRPHALVLAVKAFNDGLDVGWVYSDEDLLRGAERIRPYFKPDWSPTLLCGQNVLSHFSMTRTELVRAVGGFRPELDGSQDWDLALRVTERLGADEVVHVPHVLYHWRMGEGSAAGDQDAKPYALDAGRRATIEHLERLGTGGTHLVDVGTHHRVSFPAGSPLERVAVVVPTVGELQRVRACLEGLLRKTIYSPLEIALVVDEGLVAGPEGDALRQLAGEAAVLVARAPGPFNFSEACNSGVAATTSSLVLLLNDDVVPIAPDWLHALVGQARRPGVGVVGALLLYPETNRVQHAGVLLGTEQVADHLYRGRPLDGGYFGRQLLPQELSAVTGACMLVRREALDAVGGLDPAFAGAYNDVDLCLRIRNRGWRCVYEPGAVLYHHEGASFGSHSRGRTEAYLAEVALMRARWGAYLARDPYHNPNLALDPGDPGRLAFPPRVSFPWRAASGQDLLDESA